MQSQWYKVGFFLYLNFSIINTLILKVNKTKQFYALTFYFLLLLQLGSLLYKSYFSKLPWNFSQKVVFTRPTNVNLCLRHSRRQPGTSEFKYLIPIYSNMPQCALGSSWPFWLRMAFSSLSLNSPFILHCN